MSENETESTVAVHVMHAENLCDSPYEPLPCAIEQMIAVVHHLKDKANAASAHKFDFTICPMRARVEVVEKCVGIWHDANPQKASL